MKVQPPSKMNPDMAPVDDNAHPMPYTYPRNVLTQYFPQVINPYERPIEFSEFEAKYRIVSPDNLGIDRMSLGECSRALCTMHGSKHERVREALLKEFLLISWQV